MNVIICYSTCWACKFDMCPDEPHVWWDDDDVWDEKPEYTKPLPEGRCGCPCARDVLPSPDEPRLIPDRYILEE